MLRLAIIGSSDLGQQIAYHAINDKHYNVVGFIDDYKVVGSLTMGIPVLGGIEDIQNLYNNNIFDVLMIGIGYRHFEMRSKLYNEFSQIIPFGTIVHSSSYVDLSCKVGNGVIIYPGSILDMNVIIEDNVLINTGCTIAHDTIVGKHSFLSPAVKLAGFIKVGVSVNLGIGTIVKDNIKISDNIRTGAGSVIVNDLNEIGTYIGLPAKKMII